jgi:hypothetical protein
MDCNDHKEFFAKPGTSNRDQRENAEGSDFQHAWIPPAARGTIHVKTPGFISMLEMSTGVTDFCKFIVSIGAGATADSSIVLFS